MREHAVSNPKKSQLFIQIVICASEKLQKRKRPNVLTSLEFPKEDFLRKKLGIHLFRKFGKKKQNINLDTIVTNLAQFLSLTKEMCLLW